MPTELSICLSKIQYMWASFYASHGHYVAFENREQIQYRFHDRITAIIASEEIGFEL